MDPEATLAAINDELSSPCERYEALTDLEGWLRKGGYTPFGSQLTEEAMEAFADSGDMELAAAVQNALVNADNSGLGL